MHEITLTLSEAVGVIGIFIILLGGLIGFYSWVKVKFAQIDILIAEINERVDLHKNERIEADDRITQKLEKEGTLLSREITNGQARVYDKLDQVLKSISDIRVTCAAHNGFDPATIKIK